MRVREEYQETVEQLRIQEYDPKGVEFSQARSYLGEHQRRDFGGADISEVFHENTKTNAVVDKRVQATYAELRDLTGIEEVFSKIDQDYHGHERVELPTDVSVSGDLEAALARRRSVREFVDGPITREELSRLLLYGCGKHQFVGDDNDVHRTYPSAGALYPVEVYPLVLSGEDIEPGAYYYNARDHDLRQLRRGGDSFADEVHDVFPVDNIDVRDAQLILAFTGAFWRTKAKYGPQGYRFTLQESGHLAQNVLLVATLAEFGGVPLASFRDDKLNDLLGIDGVNEAAVYTLALGKR